MKKSEQQKYRKRLESLVQAGYTEKKSFEYESVYGYLRGDRKQPLSANPVAIGDTATLFNKIGLFAEMLTNELGYAVKVHELVDTE